jgi:hypothetical protein
METPEPKPTHSPLPWQVDPTPISNWIVDKNDVVTANLLCRSDQNDTNAAFTVRACNNHDALLRALKDVEAQGCGNFKDKSCGHPFYCNCPFEAARAAIVNAEK